MFPAFIDFSIKKCDEIMFYKGKVYVKGHLM